MAAAQGVPIVDPKSIIQHGLEIAQMSYLTGARELETDKKRRIDALHQDQLDALDATLAMMTGQTPWIGDLEVIPGAEAEVLYAVEDNNPYADRLFGDAKTSIEEMIVSTAQKYAGHPGLARAGLNPVEFRIWFQSLVKQESGFSIGARSPVGAFGLTQVMPDTAKGLALWRRLRLRHGASGGRPMSEPDPAEKLAARMERMKPSEAPKRRRGVNPYALSAVTAVAGVGVGAWLVLAAPDAPAPAPAIETASVSDFQGDGTGTDGFSLSRPKPQIVPAAPDRSEAERLQAEVDALTAQIADLKANPVTDEATLEALKAHVEALDAEAKPALPPCRTSSARTSDCRPSWKPTP